MLFIFQILGIDSEFCNVESFVTGVVDHWSSTLRPHRKKFTLAVCFAMFLLGIPMVTEVRRCWEDVPNFIRKHTIWTSSIFQGGAYIFQLMDFYAASGMSLLWVCFFQTIAISWIFGADKFCNCVFEMTGIKPNMFWYITWAYLAPTVMLVSIEL